MSVRVFHILYISIAKHVLLIIFFLIQMLLNILSILLFIMTCVIEMRTFLVG